MDQDAQRKGLTAINGTNALITVIVIVQMWLVSAALESALAGRDDAALPAAVVSGILFAGCLLLLRFVSRVDREMRR